MKQKSLLIVWVYFPAVGHFVEAIETAANFRAAYPDFKIDIMVNDQTVFQLGAFCDWIDTTYAINTESKNLINQEENKLESLEFFYDYVVFPKRLKYTPKDYPQALLDCNLLLQDFLKPKVWGGYNEVSNNSIIDVKEILYSEFQMNLPESILKDAQSKISGYPVFSVVLKGASSESIWPKFSTWKRILSEVKHAYPNAVFLITGLTKMHLKHGIDLNQAQKEINQFVVSIPGAINCYDIGLEQQLGLIQLSDILISPHTGFAFLAPCVGTPWLALSGTKWAEPMIAHLPFYYVLPSCSHYPCSNDMKLECKLRLNLNVPVKCMADLSNRTKELLSGIQKLLDKSYTFDESFKHYDLEATNKNVNKQKLWRLTEFNNYHKKESIS